ncbi:MAG: ABC transporter permease [Actinomycetota bacterium]|nr:ABC transporter permease [Actinomycetota bacterium]
MLLAQAAIELRLALRHGEQILLTLIIPVLLTLLLVLGSLVATDGSSRADYFLPGILALAVVSSAFTGLAIATGFERKYGVLKRLGATAMPRSVLLGGKTLAVLGIEALQLAVLSVLGLALGWQPRGTVVGAAVIVLLGTAAFAGLGLLLAGTLRAEATLAAANLVWFLLLLGGGLLLPLSRLSDSAAAVLQFLPSAALADGLRAVFQDGSALPAQPAFILLAWSVLAFAAAVRWFRWE